MRRRSFLVGASAGLAFAGASWADFGGPLYLTAGNKPDNSTWLVGLDLGGKVHFVHPLPGRGHAAASHPERTEAVAFARRPGNFALVIDCGSGREIQRLYTPDGLHFYGHGAFTADGRYLLTTENAYNMPDGRIGIWDTTKGYERVGDVPSGGLGPHEIIRLTDGSFAVANGGIRTHPDFQRAKLNIPSMQTNLALLSETGELRETIPLEGEMRQNSVRHIDADGSGRVFAALQWQGPPGRNLPLAAVFAAGKEPVLLNHPQTHRLKHYAGSIAISEDGTNVAVTGPKGDHVLVLNAGGQAVSSRDLPVASGVAKAPHGLAITCSGGLALLSGGKVELVPVAGNWSWDNHLVRVF